jgi:hypothetical protein
VKQEAAGDVWECSVLNPLARLVACRLEATRPPPNACFVWRADPPASEWRIKKEARRGEVSLTVPFERGSFLAA